jgi:hypothetical protein
MRTTELKRPITFATFDAKIDSEDFPSICPLCGAATTKYIYSGECTNLDGECPYEVEFKEEEPEAPDTYNWVLNK